MKKWVMIFCFFCCVCGQASQRIKVACVGNSVTYGAGIDQREQFAYPARLQEKLGREYEVRNFGKSGSTLLTKGHRPYTEQEEYQAALDFQPDWVIIHLGLNDTDPRNWPGYQDEFVKDYLSLIHSFKEVNPDGRILICRLTPISHRHSRFKSGTRDWYWQIQGLIEKIAEIADVELIDLQKELYKRPDLLPDGLHPNAEGAEIIAQTVYEGLTGNYGGLWLPELYSDHMILQRDTLIRISGRADRAQKVIVRMGEQHQETVAGWDGAWEINLMPLDTERSYELEVAASNRKFIYKDVRIGEIWLCSGQSNMAFPVSGSIEKEREEQLAYGKKQPPIRLFNRRPSWETNPVEWELSALDSLQQLNYYKPTQWTVADTESTDQFSAVAFAFGRMLADSLQVPIGLILNAVGGAPIEAWIDRKTLEFDFTDILYDWKKNDFIQDWVRQRASHNIKKSQNSFQRHPYEPCYLYETGIIPLTGFPVKGVIWYQGESNAHNPEAYAELFPLLIKSWRTAWKKELPFYYVQLSGINRSGWPWFRNLQREMMYKIPLTGMAVSSDRGDLLDVHPVWKKDIGERLGRWALNQTYGYSVIPSGPLVHSVDFVEGVAWLRFDYGDQLRTSDGLEVRTFEIAEKEGVWFPAKALIVNDRVKVWSEGIVSPTFVRYGWQPFTDANLVNGDGLPASTFRIEK